MLDSGGGPLPGGTLPDPPEPGYAMFVTQMPRAGPRDKFSYLHVKY
jgi:hypothetical protein